MTQDSDTSRIEQLANELRNDDFAVRMSAVHALGSAQDQQALSLLIAAVADDDELVRGEVIIALGSYADYPSAVATVITALNDGDPGIRVIAADTLGYMNSPMGVIPLIETMQRADEKMREAVINALGEIVGSVQLGTLDYHMRADPSDSVRQSAAYALSNKYIYDQATREEARQYLEAAANDPDPRIRECAVKALIDS